jgi:hypothetical protein
MSRTCRHIPESAQLSARRAVWGPGAEALVEDEELGVGE